MSFGWIDRWELIYDGGRLLPHNIPLDHHKNILAYFSLELTYSIFFTLRYLCRILTEIYDHGVYISVQYWLCNRMDIFNNRSLWSLDYCFIRKPCCSVRTRAQCISDLFLFISGITKPTSTDSSIFNNVVLDFWLKTLLPNHKHCFYTFED